MNAAGVKWHRRVDETSCSSCGAEPARGERRESSRESWQAREEEEGPAVAASSSAEARGESGQVVTTSGGGGGEGIAKKGEQAESVEKK